LAVILVIVQANVWLFYQGWALVTPLMTPQGPPGERRPWERWMSVRDAAGIGMAGAALAYWRGLRDISVSDAFQNWLNGLADSVVVALVALFVSCLALLAVHRHGARRALLRRLSVPFAVASSYCVGAVLPLLAMSWAGRHLPKASIGASGWEHIGVGVLGLGEIVVLLAVMVFWLGAVLHASILAARYFFRVDDAHPALRSICLACVGIWSLFVGVLNLVRHGADPKYPLSVAILLCFVGPVSIVALSGWDLVQQSGSHLRRGPLLGRPTVAADTPRESVVRTPRTERMPSIMDNDPVPAAARPQAYEP
jgi:hypothetical protein